MCEVRSTVVIARSSTVVVVVVVLLHCRFVRVGYFREERSAIRIMIHARTKISAVFNLAILPPTVKFNAPPIFPRLRYNHRQIYCVAGGKVPRLREPPLPLKVADAI